MNAHQRRKKRRRLQKMIRETWDAVQAVPSEWRSLPLLEWHRRLYALLDKEQP